MKSNQKDDRECFLFSRFHRNSNLSRRRAKFVGLYEKKTKETNNAV